MIRVALGGRTYTFDPPQRPDPPGLVWREVAGWACDCAGPSAGHPAVGCAGRYRVTTRVPIYPERDRERLARARECAEQEATEGERSGVIVSMKDVSAPVPPGAERMLRGGRPAGTRKTYAKAWGRRKTGTGEGAFEPWPVESIAVRIPRIGWACWTRYAAYGGRQATAWRAAGAMALWRGKWYRVGHPDFGRMIAHAGKRNGS